MKQLREMFPPFARFALTFGVCYGGASWLAMRHASLPAWNLAFERRVPFVPSFALVYLTIIPVLCAAPFVFRTREDIEPFTTTLIVETLIATLFFLVVPQTTAFHRPPVTGWIGVFFRAADTLNLESNQFPSLHVAFACTAAWTYGKRRPLLWSMWCIAVSASAWLIWEHHLVDLIGGALLAVACVTAVRARRTLWIEACCLVQCAGFSVRHIRYFVIFLAIWIPSLRSWRELRVVRLAFVVAQWIDDLLDGDRRSSREPLEIIDSLSSDHSALARLTAALRDELRPFPNADRDFFALVATMRRDRERVLRAEQWTEQQLDAHHRETFTLSVDLMLRLTHCRTRAAEVPSLIEALAWCSVFRDLHDDLGKGLNNVPSDIDPIAWPAARHRRASEALAMSRMEIAALNDPRAQRILGTFQRSIERFAQRAPAVILSGKAREGSRDALHVAEHANAAPPQSS
jgi:hypothetical protein